MKRNSCPHSSCLISLLKTNKLNTKNLLTNVSHNHSFSEKHPVTFVFCWACRRWMLLFFFVGCWAFVVLLIFICIEQLPCNHTVRCPCSLCVIVSLSKKLDPKLLPVLPDWCSSACPCLNGYCWWVGDTLRSLPPLYEWVNANMSCKVL